MLEQVVVEALTRNVKEDHVREIFGKYGVIKDLRMPMNPTFNINRGVAYILYEEVDEAERAIAKMHDAQLDGARIQVSIVLPKRRFSQTPPPARRGPPPRERFQDDFDGGYGRGGRPPRGGGPPGAYRPPPMDGPGRAVVEDEEAMAVDHGRIQDLEAARRGEAYHVLRTVDHHQERHQDAEAEEAEGDIADVIVHHGEVVVAAAGVVEMEVEQGGVQATAHMAATVTAAGAGTADEKIVSARGIPHTEIEADVRVIFITLLCRDISVDHYPAL
ncbi:RNA-binding protein [Pyrenophora teres f. maculata]|nr:RNA-binding protein [Pyrenophora teres f. maculata]